MLPLQSNDQNYVIASGHAASRPACLHLPDRHPPAHSPPAAQSPLSLVRQDAYASLAAALDSYLRDPAAAGAVLPALARVWPELLASIALGLRQAPPAGGAAGGAGGGAAGTLGGASGPLAYRAVGPGELTAMIRVLELACLLAAHARQSSLGAGVLPALVAQLPAAPPGLACAALDALLALQLRHPAAFVAFSDLGGVQQVGGAWPGELTLWLGEACQRASCMFSSERYACLALGKHVCLASGSTQQVPDHRSLSPTPPSCLAPLGRHGLCTAGLHPAARPQHAGASAQPRRAIPEPTACSGKRMGGQGMLCSLLGQVCTLSDAPRSPVHVQQMPLRRVLALRR